MTRKGCSRCCATCAHFEPRETVIAKIKEEQRYGHDIPDDFEQYLAGVEGICEEGGYTEIGNANAEKTKEDCSAWSPLNIESAYNNSIPQNDIILVITWDDLQEHAEQTIHRKLTEHELYWVRKHFQSAISEPETTIMDGAIAYAVQMETDE